MTKHKQNGLRPTKSPHDGIHTCSKGCKKPWCNRGLRDEIDELKAEVESLKKPAVIGGYNISEYIRMANSETLEFDNGDIFADMTLPERIKYIVKSHARLTDEIERILEAGNGMDNAISEIDPQRLERHRFMRMTDAEYVAVMKWRVTKNPNYNRA